MRRADAIVVGGGPAGSTCAWKLREAGVETLVLDRAAFPRTKLCAGWVTPEAMADLELDPADYPRGLVTFDRLALHWKWFTLRPATTQYSIRRYEFDDFLLRRAGVPVINHRVREIRVTADGYELDGAFRCRYLVGAGGTACPVYKTLFADDAVRAPGLQTATLEQEFPYDWRDPDCHLWFFDDGLPGYAWYVPKENGWINVGLGAMAGALRQSGGHLKSHWERFTERLRQRRLVDHDAWQPGGYSYYLNGGPATLRKSNACVIGDAAGLATRDLCEGIGPAIRSGRLAAAAIVEGAAYDTGTIAKLSGSGPASRLLERRFAAGA